MWKDKVLQRAASKVDGKFNQLAGTVDGSVRAVLEHVAVLADPVVGAVSPPRPTHTTPRLLAHLSPLLSSISIRRRAHRWHARTRDEIEYALTYRHTVYCSTGYGILLATFTRVLVYAGKRAERRLCS